MRIFAFIIIFLFTAYSCVKKPSTSPIPTIEYLDFKAEKVSGIDNATLTIGYEDGDGDIFRDKTLNGPNVIGTFYYLNSGTKTFMPIFPDPITLDTFRITQTVIQPKDGDYKGKSVQGTIFLPWAPFRSGDSVKVFKYTLFVQDENGHRSNVITTPVFTVNF